LKLISISRRTIAVILGFAVVLSASLVFASPRKRSKSDRDINAIGHRRIVPVTPYYSAQDLKRGDAMSAAYEQSVTLLRDPSITSYVDGLAQRLAQNSDAVLLIKVRIVETNEIDVWALPGGYQYITRGLLLSLKNEGELAGTLAHGIAHTALYTSARQAMRAALMQIPPKVPQTTYGEFSFGQSSSLMLLSFHRDDELDADYFGMQYVYKTGYDPECYVGVIQRLQPSHVSSRPEVFPEVPERVKAIHKELETILPARGNTAVASPEFSQFQQRLRSLPPLPPDESDGMPKLIRESAPPQ
jgi:beta-barrel assembly-enhancing protease